MNHLPPIHKQSAELARTYRLWDIGVVAVRSDRDGRLRYAAIGKDPLGAGAGDVTQWCPGDLHSDFCETREEAVEQVETLIEEELSISCG